MWGRAIEIKYHCATVQNHWSRQYTENCLNLEKFYGKSDIEVRGTLGFLQFFLHRPRLSSCFLIRFSRQLSSELKIPAVYNFE